MYAGQAVHCDRPILQSLPHSKLHLVVCSVQFLRLLRVPSVYSLADHVGTVLGAAGSNHILGHVGLRFVTVDDQSKMFENPFFRKPPAQRGFVTKNEFLRLPQAEIGNDGIILCPNRRFRTQLAPPSRRGGPTGHLRRLGSGVEQQSSTVRAQFLRLLLRQQRELTPIDLLGSQCKIHESVLSIFILGHAHEDEVSLLFLGDDRVLQKHFSDAWRGQRNLSELSGLDFPRARAHWVHQEHPRVQPVFRKLKHQRSRHTLLAGECHETHRPSAP
mmetsp:Transcript_3065/g.8885  ORF Transcript_3065/g.8885 Transcript_3065/m.8885 type:complete len:273 (-) Transcript_3065:3-821(-)